MFKQTILSLALVSALTCQSTFGMGSETEKREAAIKREVATAKVFIRVIENADVRSIAQNLRRKIELAVQKYREELSKRPTLPLSFSVDAEISFLALRDYGMVAESQDRLSERCLKSCEQAKAAMTLVQQRSNQQRKTLKSEAAALIHEATRQEK